ncbi:MAG: DUF1028 domain-containing protein [Saprospiraceae bacterium]|nr:DUF1028 domain-containing protein [Saprospiraceae bacterium]MDW8483714.1 DUF1028 domain-containing protein [Saprospiraceae bacterium]
MLWNAFPLSKRALLFASIALQWNTNIGQRLTQAEAKGFLFSQEPFAHTFSIVARDSANGEMGVAVQSHWFGVGALVSWAEVGVGVIATQSFVNKSFGPRRLALMRQGLSAQQEALDSLLKNDPGRAVRQVALLDAKGRVAVHTGERCIAYACQTTGTQYSVQANMMLGPDVCSAMQLAWETSRGRPLAERLLLMLEAAQAMGGDFRGQQSAVLLIVRGQRTQTPWEDRLVDLRVDDHPSAVAELRWLYTTHPAYEYMNCGDHYLEINNIDAAIREYSLAHRLLPERVELQFWTALTLANAGQMNKALPLFAEAFKQAPIWKIVLPRLHAAELFSVSAADMEQIMKQ